MSEVYQDSRLAFLESDNSEMAQQLSMTWRLLHRLAEATRTTGELNHPKLFKDYDWLCEHFGETPRQAKILK